MAILRVACHAALIALLGLPLHCQVPVQQPAEGANTLRGRALAAEQAGDHARAAELFLQLVAAEPERWEWVKHAGDCLGRAGRFNDAIDLLDEKRKKFPGQLDLPALLARTLLLKAEAEPESTTPSGLLDQAAAIAGEVLAVDPDHLEAGLILAQARYQQGNAGAADAAAEVCKRHPDKPGGHILLGRIHADRCRQLMQQLEASALDEREQPRVREQMVAERQAARDSLARAVAVDPDRPIAHVLLGRLAADGDDAKTALLHFA